MSGNRKRLAVKGERTGIDVIRPVPHRAASSRSGQVVVFLLIAFTALIFVLLFNVDLHRIIQRKDQTQNAGDAAALAAARWQGSTINLVGELNLLHALALSAQDATAVDAITNMQARLCFTGPLTGLFAAQVAAKNNHIYVDSDMTTLLSEHASLIRTQYASKVGTETYFTEPWPNAWSDYASMLDAIVADGIAAGPDNTQYFLDPSAGHLLCEKAFYEAIEGQNWCWFYLHAPKLLESYGSYHDWPPLPNPDKADYADCEIFGIGLRPVVMQMKNLFSAETLSMLITDARLDTVGASALAATNVMESPETWYFYNDAKWTEWTRIKPDGADAFPVVGPVRTEYDYAGADVVVRVYASVDRLTPGLGGGTASDKVLWTSAAKPFGYLDANGEKKRPDSAASFVLPAFRNVRLIPIDAASGSENSSSDSEWVRHLRSHLHTYLETGPSTDACRYCQALAVWENQAFRQTGIDWLDLNCDSCKETAPGRGRGGGSRRGH